jgi:glycosyltransferase involved in cell wall biosynthesis
MNVLIYDGSSGFGGATTTLVGLVSQLQRRGARVDIAACHDDGWHSVGLADLVHRLPAEFAAIRGLAFAAREYRRAVGLSRLLDTLNVDVVVANNDPAVNAAAYLATEARGIPVVQLIRGHARASSSSQVLLERAAAIYSHGGPDEARRAGFVGLEQRWRRLDEGLSRQHWPRRRRVDAHRWVWASTLARWKGLPLLLEAYGALSEPPPLDVCYLPLAADHCDAASLPPTVPRGVTLHRKPPDLDGIRAQSSVYVHTAVVPEPFGRSILEAMAAGLCPIVSDEGGGARLVRHKETGIVYEARSLSSLQAAMQLAQSNPGLVDACGAAAAVAAQAWSNDVVLGGLIDTIAHAPRRP